MELSETPSARSRKPILTWLIASQVLVLLIILAGSSFFYSLGL